MSGRAWPRLPRCRRALNREGCGGVVFVPRVRVLVSPQCEIGLLIFGGLLASSRVGRAREACALGGDGGVCVMRAAL